MFISTRTEEESARIFELRGPGGTACFSVGCATGLRSSVWYVQSPRKSPDIYVGNLALSDYTKASLHTSGEWHFALVREYAQQTLANPAERFLEKWRRPSEAVPGWTAALRIWVPHADLTSYDGLPTPVNQFLSGKCNSENDVVWVPDPGPRVAIGFHVVIGKPDQGEVKFDGYTLLGGFSLAPSVRGQEACLILCSWRDLSGEDEEFLNNGRELMRAECHRRNIDITSSMRGYLYGQDEQGIRSFWDVAPSSNPR